jgi:hypothetical protein
MIPQQGLKFRIRPRTNLNAVLATDKRTIGDVGKLVLRPGDSTTIDNDCTWVPFERSTPMPLQFHLRLIHSPTTYLHWSDDGQLSMTTDKSVLDGDSSVFVIRQRYPDWANHPDMHDPSGNCGWLKLRRIWTDHWANDKPDDQRLAQGLEISSSTVGKDEWPAVNARANWDVPQQDWFIEYKGPLKEGE